MAVLIQATELYARIGMLQFDDVWRAVAETRGPEALDAENFEELRSLTLRAREALTQKRNADGVRSDNVHDSFRVAWDIYQVSRKTYNEFRCKKEPGLRQKMRATVFLDPPMRSSTYEPLLPIAEVRLVGR